jgi:hypothetical protein
MRKYYFSRAETRAMALDHPIGDPTGGAAYGEKNDPVSAVISLATMAGTYGTTMTVMQGITFAGAALNLVGNVSGNKTLQKIGMIAGIAGGIGSFAEAKGLISKTPQLGSTKIGESLGFKTSPTATTGTAPLSGSTAASSGNAQYAGVNVQPGATTAAPTVTTPAPSAAADVFDDAAARARATTPYGGIDSGLNKGVSDLANVTPPPPDTSSVWESVKGAGKSLMDFTKENPGGAVMIGSTASTLADYLTGKTDAEIDALEAQKSLAGAKAEEIQEAINNERRRRQNLNEGWAQVDTGIQVNPNVSMKPAGLISQQMPQQA